MLKLVFVLVNFYDKLFITDRTIHINEPSLTKWTNERDNFRHDKHQNLHNQTFFYQLRKRKKNFTSTIFFLNYILNYNFFFFLNYIINFNFFFFFFCPFFLTSTPICRSILRLLFFQFIFIFPFPH